jgi:hypothetical protein
MKKNRKITACNRLDMEITRVVTGYAQKSPRTLFGMSRVDYMLSLGMEPGKNVTAVDFTYCYTENFHQVRKLSYLSAFAVER